MAWVTPMHREVTNEQVYISLYFFLTFQKKTGHVKHFFCQAGAANSRVVASHNFLLLSLPKQLIELAFTKSWVSFWIITPTGIQKKIDNGFSLLMAHMQHRTSTHIWEVAALLYSVLVFFSKKRLSLLFSPAYHA